MSDFIVSARKYRPATFRSVVGQKHITSTLQNAIERGQLAHAYLFCGPRGVGKTTCARIFAKAINCLSPHGAEACSACESCRSFDEGRSMNIHELDAASNNSVDDIRSLIEQVRIIPQVGRYSVFIIDEVHMLSAAAFNAFLKTLEEPPAHAVFILATTEKHKIIPTILSRCQIYDFNRIRVEDAVEYLRYIASEEGVTADEESLNLIAQKADGGMRDALSMFDKAVSFCGRALDYRSVAQTLNVLDYDTYFGVTESLLAGNYFDVLIRFDEILSKGFSGQTFMAGLNRHMRDLLMAKHPDTLRLIEMTGTLLERYRVQAEACTVGFLFGAIACLTELDGKIRQSSNQRLLVELGLMKISGLGQKKNDTLTSFGSYPLPELTQRAAQPEAVRPETARVETVQPGTSADAARPAAQTIPSGAPAAQSAPAAPSPAESAEARYAPAAQSPAPASDIDSAAAASAPVVPAPAAETATAPPAEPAEAPQAPAPSAASVTSVTSATPTPTIPATEQADRPQPAEPLRDEQPAQAQPAAMQPETAAAEAAASNSPRPARRSLVSGTSLSDLLATAAEPDGASADEAPAAVQAPVVDAACAEKLERVREGILNLIRERRPRFVAAFELMQFRGNTISVSVPTTELRDEIMRSRTSMLRRFAELAGVEGTIRLEVTVDERIRAARPIKLEDRVRYITEKNPLVAELRKALDLEAE